MYARLITHVTNAPTRSSQMAGLSSLRGSSRRNAADGAVRCRDTRASLANVVTLSTVAPLVRGAATLPGSGGARRLATVGGRRHHPQPVTFLGGAWGKTFSPPPGWCGSRGLSTQEGKEKEKEGEQSDEGESPGEEGDEMAALREALEKSEGQLKDTRNKALYLAAEMENVRSIAKRDAESARLYAVQKFAKQLLDVADNLGRALTSAKEAGEASGDCSHDVLLQGLEMTSGELQKVFRGQGLEKYGEEGDKFDPHLHDAMFEFPDPAQEPGTVGQVLKCGYKLHGRVIRAAQVGTVKAS